MQIPKLMLKIYYKRTWTKEELHYLVLLIALKMLASIAAFNSRHYYSP